MKLSQSFIKTFREVGKEETSRNAELLIRAGYIYKEMAGVYDFLPLGLITLNKIQDIIRDELDAIGCQEMQMTALQNPESWVKTDRWRDDVIDVWFKTKLNAGGELGLAPTHEEPLTNLMTKYISSYKDLPVYVYQFQTKFRNELRAKSGILRTREFLMKDLYSFTKSKRPTSASMSVSVLVIVPTKLTLLVVRSLSIVTNSRLSLQLVKTLFISTMISLLS